MGNASPNGSGMKEQSLRANFSSGFLKSAAILERLDEELRQQNAPIDKRIKALRERYLEWMKRFNQFGPIYEGEL